MRGFDSLQVYFLFRPHHFEIWIDPVRAEPERMMEENMSQDSANKRSGSRSTTQRRSKVQQRTNRNSILIVILSLVVIISIIAGVMVNLGKKSSDTNASGQQTAPDATIDVVENNNDLELNKYPEVNELIENYRRAFLSGDTELLKQVYNSDQDINADILTATSQIIESYENTQYYTKRGINAGEYVVFVYDELKLSGIDTLAPNLSVFYVKPTDSGSLYIYRGNYNAASGTYVYEDEVQNYINELYQDADVSELITTVNTRMDSACANDSDLMDFMERVRSRTPVETSAPESEVQTESETQAPQTETEAATEAQETEAQEDQGE